MSARRWPLRVLHVKTGDDDYADAEVYNLAAIELMWRRLGLDAVNQPLQLLPAAMSEPDEADGLLYRPGFEN